MQSESYRKLQQKLQQKTASYSQLFLFCNFVTLNYYINIKYRDYRVNTPYKFYSPYISIYIIENKVAKLPSKGGLKVESEKITEKYLRDEIKKIRGFAYKFVSPGNAGVPDRLICLPGGKVVFVELKSEGKHSTTRQKLQHGRLIALGFKVYADIDTKAKVDEIVRDLKDGIHTA